jgi:hypothetical protein
MKGHEAALPFTICLATAALVSLPARSDDHLVRVHGAVSQFDGNDLTIKSDSGKSVVVGVRPETRIVHSRTTSLSDIKSGDFVGSLSLRDATGKLRALGLRVFQNSVEANGEGQYPTPSDPSRIVTDGSVSAVSVPDVKLTLTFHGSGAAVGGDCTGRATPGGWGCTGSADLIVARGVPIVAISSGDPTLLRVGAIVSVTATADAASLLSATVVSVERDAKPVQ